MSILPKFQAQNPAISGYYLGWSSCTAFSGAMAASFEKQVPEIVTGGTLRSWTGDTVGGLNLSQIDAALNAHLSIDLDTHYQLPWSTFVDRINAGAGAVLQGWYAPIAYSKFDAGNGFKGNHAIFVPPNWGVMDPLADGRTTGVYKYHGEVYPQLLLKDFAGRLNVGGSTYTELGSGLCYAAFTHDHPLSVPAPAPTAQVVLNAPAPAEKNVMIPTLATLASNYVMHLAKGQPLFRYPGGPKVTAMSIAAAVPYIGTAGSGWRAVKVSTGVPYADHLVRPTILYVPAAAGSVEAK